MTKLPERPVLLLAIWEMIKTLGMVFITFALLCFVVITIIIIYLWATGGML